MGKVLHSLTDMNGDRVADLMTFSLEGRNISSKRSTYEVHFGTPTADGGIVFAPEVGAAFQSDGSIQLGWTDTTLIATARLTLCDNHRSRLP